MTSPVHEVHRDLAAPLGELWTAVTRAGGAVGFLPDEPEADIRAAAERAAQDARAGRLHVVAISDGSGLAGVAFLQPGLAPRKDHTATVLRLMVHPARQGQGLGRALLDGVVARARELGLEQLLLSARGGTTLPAFYRARGWTEVGVWPGVLRLGDERRDEHWFQLDVR